MLYKLSFFIDKSSCFILFIIFTVMFYSFSFEIIVGDMFKFEEKYSFGYLDLLKSKLVFFFFKDNNNKFIFNVVIYLCKRYIFYIF